MSAFFLPAQLLNPKNQLLAQTQHDFEGGRFFVGRSADSNWHFTAAKNHQDSVDALQLSRR